MNEFHEANRKGWDAVSPGWQAKIDERGAWRRAATDPTVAFAQLELNYLGDVSGKQICVLGSGDNIVTFALAGMGAQVTSVDISQTQLDTAAERARSLDLAITFVRADVTELAPLAANSFDVVYTGGHVAVWVSDLNRYYAEAGRILKPGGLFIVNEYHPFRRIWKWGSEQLEVESPYFDRGPHQYDRAGEAGSSEALPSYEFHWTIADFVAALQKGGCTLVALHEFGDQGEDWEAAPLTGLPQCLLLVGKKHAELRMNIKIVDLLPTDTKAIEQAARLLNEEFNIMAPTSWTTMAEAYEEVQASFVVGRISKVALNDASDVVGWIGGKPNYAQVWELHPLVVRGDCQRQGVGRALVAALEEAVKARGGLTIILGSDDENDQTSLSGIDLYPNPLEHLAHIKNRRGHPYEFYQKAGFTLVGVVPDANGFGKPDILLAKRVV